MTPERLEKFHRVVAQRQNNLTVIIENVHDPHNIGAVLRSCDSIGIMEVYVLNTEDHLKDKDLYLGKRTTSGSRKWVDVQFYTDVNACFKAVKSKYDLVLATHLDEAAKGLYELDLCQSIALLFGNEHAGISKEALSYCDGNFIIPQMGMVESLNISVACAVTLYEALRQRKAAGFYDANAPLSAKEQAELLKEYTHRHVTKPQREYISKIND